MPRHITTDRLVLRPFTSADGARVVALLNDFAVSKWLAKVPYPFTAADLRLLNTDGSERWPDLAAITLQGKVVGAVSANAHFGYWIARDHWGQGIATEATRAMLDYAFTHGDQDVIESGYFEGNTASARVLDRLGFEVVSRDYAFSAAQAKEVANVNLALTRREWEARS